MRRIGSATNAVSNAVSEAPAACPTGCVDASAAAGFGAATVVVLGAVAFVAGILTGVVGEQRHKERYG